MEGAGEQQEAGEAEESYRGEDLLRPQNVRKLQAPEALRQQRSSQGSLQRSRLDRRSRRHHLSQGIINLRTKLRYNYIYIYIYIYFFFFCHQNFGVSPR